MIMIMSQAWDEPTTERVAEWLAAWNLPYTRLNASDLEIPGCVAMSITNDSTTAHISLGGQTIDPALVSTAWYRKWSYRATFRHTAILSQNNQSIENIAASCSHLNWEMRAFSLFFFSLFTQTRWLGDPNNSAPNKLEVLTLAANLGMSVPETYICTDQQSLRAFLAKHPAAVTKPIRDMVTIYHSEGLAMSYTTEVPHEAVSGGPDSWRGGFPTCFQERLDKQYEVRTFYIDGECYSSAIFPESHGSASVDSRRYEYEHPPRICPYKLSQHTEKQIRDLMKCIGHDTGSLDFIKADDGRLIFLEVNPVGQIGYVSEYCNYNIERRIAKALVERHNER